MNWLRFAILFGMTQNAWAKVETHDLLSVTVDTEPGVEYRLLLDIDSETRALKQMTYTDGTPQYRLKFQPHHLANKGVVMKEEKDVFLTYDAAITVLKSEKGFTHKDGGHLDLVVMRKFKDDRVLDLHLKLVDEHWKLFYKDKEFDILNFYVLRKKDPNPTAKLPSPMSAGDEIGVKMLELKKDEKTVAKMNTAGLPEEK